VDGVGIGSAASASVQSVDAGDFFRRKRKIEDIDIFGDPRGREGFGNGAGPVLDVPAQHDLRGRFAVLLRETYYDGIGERVRRLVAELADAVAKRRPSLGENAEPGMRLPRSLLIEQRMQLDLVYGRDRLDLL